MMTVFDKRAPFVRFEERELGLNQEATTAAGRPVPRVVLMACITPHGSKDVVEKVATEWLEQIKQQALRGQYPADWVSTFKLQYDEYLKGNELPRDGTPIQTWPAVSKQEIVWIKAVGITTVEDLAAVPDSALGSIGMNGRYLRDKARNWIDGAKDIGVVATKLANADMRITELETLAKDQRATIEALRVQLDSMRSDDAPRRGPGRPRKDEQLAT